MPSKEVKAIVDSLFSGDSANTNRLRWNYVIGCLAGNGVGPNSSFFTFGKSVVIGNPDAEGVVQITLKCDVEGPLMNGIPGPHSVYFVIPRDALPNLAKRLRFIPEVTRVGDTDADNEIVPPKYSQFSFVLSTE